MQDEKSKKIKKRVRIVETGKRKSGPSARKALPPSPRTTGSEGRFWKDSQNRKTKKGKYSPDEINRLQAKLVEHALENGMSLDELFRRLTSTPLGPAPPPSPLTEAGVKDRSRFWCAIAECLPGRSVQSIQNVCKRRFNPMNYGGKWLSRDVEYLKRYTRRYGNEWVKIAKALGRTPDNVKDKAKSLKLDAECSQYWDADSLVRLLEMLNEGRSLTADNARRPVDFGRIRAQLRDEAGRVVRERDADVSEASPIVLKRVERAAIRKLAESLDARFLESVKIKNWKRYASRLKSRSPLEIKNFYEQKLRVRLGLAEQSTKPRVLLGLVAAVARQRPTWYSDVEFSLVENNYSEQANQSGVL